MKAKIAVGKIYVSIIPNKSIMKRFIEASVEVGFYLLITHERKCQYFHH